MSKYKRNVEYLYDFDDGIRKNSVGFARIEYMNGECKLTVHITAPNLGDRMLRISFYRMRMNKLQQFFIGEVGTRNGSGNYRGNVKDVQLEQNGWNMEELDGVLVYGSNDRYFVAAENALDMEGMEEELPQQEVLSKAPPEPERITQTPKEQVPPEPERITQTPKEQVPPEPERITQIPIEQAPPEQERMTQIPIEQAPPEPERMIQMPIDPAPPEQERMTQNSMKQGSMEQEQISEENKQLLDMGMIPERAQRVFQCCQKIYPFEDNEMMECAKLELADIGLLPMDQWSISHNSFLLHSYYLYGHMLLAKKQGRNGYQYYLMVPGIYQNKEKNIASRFGFHNFKCARRREQRQGEFGYWFLPVIYQNEELN